MSVIDEDGFDYADYCALWIDILGQKDAISRIEHLPAEGDDQARAAFIQELKRTFGVVHGISNTLQTHFEAYGRGGQLRDRLGAVDRETLDSLLDFKIHIQRAGDGLLVFCKLAGGLDAFPLGSVWRLLNSACMMMATWIGVGQQPLRGGIDIAKAGEIFAGELYGPAVVHAYELESKIAKYPRVVVGEGLKLYLEWAQGGFSDGKYKELNREMARSCHELLAVDEDDHYIVDYLGKGFRDVGKSALGGQAANLVHEFCCQQCQYWKQHSNQRLLDRYNWMKRYVESRKSLWT